ncbi:MAG: hypothetical protein MUF71_21010 [Candidatus Kapabacteria bacterium]|jgi:hypothetical protein|nr:hypothetical protein [Candidatus Kapabacteria bacterium]
MNNIIENSNEIEHHSTLEEVRYARQALMTSCDNDIQQLVRFLMQSQDTHQERLFADITEESRNKVLVLPA